MKDNIYHHGEDQKTENYFLNRVASDKYGKRFIFVHHFNHNNIIDSYKLFYPYAKTAYVH